MDARTFVNLIQPEHDRTSCSDDDIANGFYSRSDGTWHGRCTRCMYLEMIDDGVLPAGFVPSECHG